MPDYSKPLPSSEDSEKIIIGSIILDNDQAEKVIDILDPIDFYHPTYRKVYKAMKAVYQSLEPINAITIGEEMKKEGSIESIGGYHFLMSFTTGLPHISDIDSYVKIVKNKSKLRKLIHKSNEIIQSCLDEETDTPSILQNAEHSIYSLIDSSSYSGIQNSIEIIDLSLQQAHQIAESDQIVTGITTGFAELDAVTLGLQKKDLIILAARPSVGKSALASQIGQNGAYVENLVIPFFSLEMSKAQLSARIICSEAGVDSRRYRSGNLDEEEWERINTARETLEGTNFWIDDTPAISLSYIRSHLRRIHTMVDGGQKPALVIVDYLQLMTPDTQGYSRENDVSSLSRGLKSIAKEFDIPVLALSQLNRKSENRGDHRPSMGDLRESGQIEQDADVIMFLYRHDLYEKDEMQKDGIAEVIIAKNRMGPTNTIELKFIEETTKFKSLESTDF